MVSALESRSNSPGLSPGRDTALCSWARHFTLIVSLSTQVYKWVPANLQLGEEGGVEIFLVASCYGNWDKLQLDRPLGLHADLTFTQRHCAPISLGLNRVCSLKQQRQSFACAPLGWDASLSQVVAEFPQIQILNETELGTSQKATKCFNLYFI